MPTTYCGLEVFGYQFDRFAYEHPWIGEQVGDFMLGPGGGGMLEYRNATVFALPEGGAYEVHGEILAYYLKHSGPYGSLGYPISNEKPTPTGYGRYNLFERGSIGWLPEAGAFTIGGRSEGEAMPPGSEAGNVSSADVPADSISIPA